MTDGISTVNNSGMLLVHAGYVPTIVAQLGPKAADRFIEFFTANIRNPNTRRAYAQAVGQFLRWGERYGLKLPDIRPTTVAAYIEQLGLACAAPTVKQHLAAIRMLFDWLVIGQVLPSNPAGSVRGPRHVIRRGKTPVLQASDARRLLDSINIADVVGLRDRALIAVMVYSFARVSAVVGMKVQDYYRIGRRSWLRLHEKGGKFHELPAHHNAEEYVDAYVAAAGIADQLTGPLFRTVHGRTRTLTTRPMTRHDALRMIKRYCRRIGLPHFICCHTFRATGITAYLENGGTLEHAQAIAAHESPRTTKLYDRTSDQITLDEIERIVI
jgi:integrase/recombinase XerD